MATAQRNLLFQKGLDGHFLHHSVDNLREKSSHLQKIINIYKGPEKFGLTQTWMVDTWLGR